MDGLDVRQTSLAPASARSSQLSRPLDLVRPRPSVVHGFCTLHRSESAIDQGRQHLCGSQLRAM